MTRIEQPPRVIYVERNVRWSIFFVILSLGVVVGVMIAGPSKREDTYPVIAMYGGGFLLVALMTLFRARAFAVDREKGEIHILQRWFLQAGWRRVYPIAHVSVRDVARPVFSMTLGAPVFIHHVFIDVDGAPSILFLCRKGPEEPLEMARRLAGDLDRPLLHDHRRV